MEKNRILLRKQQNQSVHQQNPENDIVVNLPYLKKLRLMEAFLAAPFDFQADVVVRVFVTDYLYDPLRNSALYFTVQTAMFLGQGYPLFWMVLCFFACFFDPT